MTKKILIVLGVIVVAILLFFGYKQLKKTQEAKKTNYERINSNHGVVVQGFPNELIKNKVGPSKESYQLAYKTGDKQYTTTFETSKTVAQEYQEYLNYLKDLNYVISNQHQTDTAANLYAALAHSNVNLVITQDAGAAHPTVIITYVVKQ